MEENVDVNLQEHDMVGDATALQGGLDPMNCSVDLDEFSIVKVLDDVILCEFISELEELDIDKETGMVNVGGILMAKPEEQEFYKKAKVLMVGKNVGEIVKDDIIVLAGGNRDAMLKGGVGLTLVPVGGKELVLTREKNVFFVVK